MVDSRWWKNYVLQASPHWTKKTTRSIRWKLTKKEATHARLVNTTHPLINREGKDTQMIDIRAIVSIVCGWRSDIRAI